MSLNKETVTNLEASSMETARGGLKPTKQRSICVCFPSEVAECTLDISICLC